ncbi:MAG: hypothetical protein N3F65_00650 [Nitrososphaeria archaeon]|nr:hypothetical protein [Aigarchaeota archaeon]MCX8187106.1 hypothetical protein [Nitrososphaeria archaeon]MDW8021443.1 hypothetical protein [Nitrososphaerota archaeon]
MKLMDTGERKHFELRLRKQYGVENPFEDLVLLAAGRGRVRATTKEALEVAKKLRRVQQAGVYIAKISKEDVILSIEGSQVLNGKITKSVLDLDEESAEKWMRAEVLEVRGKYEGKYVVGKCGDLYLGSGRITRDGKLYPQVAKWRRIPVE